MLAEKRSKLPGQVQDLPQIGEVFLSAFPESVKHYVGHAIPPRVVADLFAICLDAEPGAFYVAVLNGRVAGYIFAPARFSCVGSIAVRHGHLLRMFTRWVSGQYGIGLRPVYIATRNWLILLRESRCAALHAEARILSIAVDPQAQGHGIGTGLMQRGVEYLDSQGVRVIRLEVRPENAAAIHLYEKYGFVTDGKTHDSQGAWLIMLRRKADNQPP